MDGVKPLIVIGVAFLVLAALVSGCVSSSVMAGEKKSRFLTLFAFNYTDRYIMNIVVDGVWMGGADAYTNGGSAMGPRPPRDRNKVHVVDVTWEVSGRYDMASNKYERVPVEQKSESVPIKFPYPDDPDELVLHFYPDGHVEAEMVGNSESVFDFRRIPIPEGHKDHGRE